MASGTDLPELSSAFERILTQRDLSLFLPFFLGFATTTTTSERENPDQEPPQTATPGERIILINPFTQGMVVIEGTANLDSLLRDLGSKSGQPPASKASIEAIPSVEIKETGGDKDSECVICLEEWEIGGLAKEMPCKHRFHRNCIEKWLGIHGSCPVCRYKMPVDEVELEKKRDEEEGEGRDRRRFEREIWVSFSFNSNRRSQESNQSPPTQNSNDSSSSSPTLD
ncbi:hypothetical protein JCGZ_15616 [Jatropha curcas]|uniref:RING-type E3 ubiquitin transferase n=1 Tax=Jatropha curcas TaxID=180498 RepID=A0A067LAW3_JATCU|nr:E3 ubiquitin-protein ligase MPSR1 [Jatropha curcas]KDP41209.1 hypothetical protein JCGZ_15616 [Jatropha curcas]